MRKINERLNILLLSGHEEATRQLRESLEREANLATASTPGELFGLLQRAAYDAFLCDWDCPGRGWQQICREVKQAYPALPIIVVCRCGGEKEWLQVLEAGCFDMVSAPFSARQLLSVIEHAVASSEARDCETEAMKTVA